MFSLNGTIPTLRGNSFQLPSLGEPLIGLDKLRSFNWTWGGAFGGGRCLSNDYGSGRFGVQSLALRDWGVTIMCI